MVHMADKPFSPGESLAMSMAEDFLSGISGDSLSCKYNRVLEDIARVYDDAILVGAVAAAKYIDPPHEPRVTYDVDILIGEKDFSDFLHDEIPENTLRELESRFADSDSPNHSLMHRETGIYVDLLSASSKPVSGRLIRRILENRDAATEWTSVGNRHIRILKPEYLVAMKLNRCAKTPRSERGLCDRIDIMKLLKSRWRGDPAMNHDIIRSIINRNEIKCYGSIVDDVTDEMGHPHE